MLDSPVILNLQINLLRASQVPLLEHQFEALATDLAPKFPVRELRSNGMTLFDPNLKRSVIIEPTKVSLMDSYVPDPTEAIEKSRHTLELLSSHQVLNAPYLLSVVIDGFSSGQRPSREVFADLLRVATPQLLELGQFTGAGLRHAYSVNQWSADLRFETFYADQVSYYILLDANIYSVPIPSIEKLLELSVSVSGYFQETLVPTLGAIIAPYELVGIE